MEVQARHNTNNLFRSSHQFVHANRDFMKINQEAGNSTIYHETFPIRYNEQSQNIISEAAMNKQSDSGLTYNAINPAPRKRTRDQSFHQNTNVDLFADSNPHKLAKLSSADNNNHALLDNEIAFQIQQHQCEIDRFLAQHAERVKMELEEQRKREARMLLSAFEEGIAKRLKEKDEEITRMGKLNLALQERVKTLCVENQLWKDVAQSNEATAISLRTNLEQVLLAHVSSGGERNRNDAAEEEDAESCCGSSENDKENGVVRACRGCGEEEARVLVLPCRHLCLCASCGSHLRFCPVCNSLMTASVRVNFS